MTLGRRYTKGLGNSGVVETDMLMDICIRCIEISNRRSVGSNDNLT